MLQKLVLLSVSCLLVSQAIGCVSIRSVGPTQVTSIANRNGNHPIHSQSDECCELYDRREAMQRLASRLNPAQHIPSKVVDWAGTCKVRSQAWMANQHGRCVALRGSLQGWIQAKKDEANAPPWPRFHPVPTQNVFEPQAQDSPNEQEAPETYGRFGKG